MPTRKWQIFRMISYLHLALVVGFLVIMFQQFFIAGAYRSAKDYTLFSALMLCPAILIANSSLHLYLLERYYPGHLFSPKLRRATIILSILALLVVLADTYLACLIWPELWGRSLRSNLKGFMLLWIVTGIVPTGLYLLWAQVLLRRSIRRNYQTSLETFLEHEEEPGT